MNKVRYAVDTPEEYDLAVTLDGLHRYGGTPEEMLAGAAKEGARVDGRGLPLNCATCWELRQVLRSVAGGDRSWDSISFFHSDGSPVTVANPFAD